MSIVGACASGATSPSKDQRAQAEEDFANICSKCHGREGKGGLPLSPGGPAPRNLTDPKWQASVIDEQIEATIRTGKTPMPSFQNLLTNDQIKGLVAKVRRLGKGATP